MTKRLATLALGVAIALGSRLASADCAHDAHELHTWRAMAACDEAAQGWLEDEGVAEPELALMWEACMRLATPVTVLPAAQHYDTTDGTFWGGER